MLSQCIELILAHLWYALLELTCVMLPGWSLFQLGLDLCPAHPNREDRELVCLPAQVACLPPSGTAISNWLLQCRGCSSPCVGVTQWLECCSRLKVGPGA